MRNEDIELSGEDDLSGDDDLLGKIEELVGAARRPAARPAARAPAGGVSFRGLPIRNAPPVLSNLPAGVQSGPTGKLLPVPFTVANFTGAAVAGNLTARPQCPVRGKRLVMVATGNTVAAQAIANGAVITSITVGKDNVFTNAGGVPLSTFGPGSFGVDMMIQNAAPGIDIVIAVALPAAPGADTVTVTAVLLSEAVS